MPRMRRRMDTRIPVVVRMQVKCPGCGHTEDETYEFSVPFSKSQAMEAYEPGKCPDCGAPIQMHLKRTQQRQ
jgi:DNA-directed RNA polymerase subunit RPC12/RpoP